jgi:hypothetical protein
MFHLEPTPSSLKVNELTTIWLRRVDESTTSSRISPPGVGQMSRCFGDTVVSIFRGISFDVPVAGLYFLYVLVGDGGARLLLVRRLEGPTPGGDIL